MKKIALCLAVAAAVMTIQAPAHAAAEKWLVKATFNYVKADGSIVVNQPAMEFTLGVGECRKGVTRVTQMIHADMTMTQKACLKMDAERKIITASGWLMSPSIVTDVLQQDGTRSAALSLDYGQQFEIDTNSTFVRSRVGPYLVELRRISGDRNSQEANNGGGAKKSLEAKDEKAARKLAAGKKLSKKTEDR